MIDAFIFDIGNVLLRFDYDRALAKIAVQCGNRVNFENLAPLRDEYEEGRIDRANFQKRLIDLLAYTGEEDDLVRALEEIFSENDPMIRLVERLHGRFPLFLLSNTSDLHMDYIFRTYPFFEKFADAVYSFRAGVSKPKIEIFELAVRQFGVDPARTVYIDDLAANVEGARTAGLCALHYNPDRHEELERKLAALGVDTP